MQLLLFRPTWDLLAEALAERPAIQPLLLEADGSVTRPDGSRVEQPRPDAAFFSYELFAVPDAPTRDFARIVLGSGSVRWVHSFAAGFEHPVFQRILDAGIRLTINDGSAIAIAEYVLASVMAVFHPFSERRAAQAAVSWQRLPFREIHGTRWLVLGYGAIGSAVGRRAAAFGAEVVGVRRRPAEAAETLRMVTPEALPAELTEADVVVIAAAANDDNSRLVDAAFLDRMREDSVLVNIARGSLVDEDALLRALDQGRPGTAVLDVFEAEPLPSDHRFWTHPSVRLTAHCSAASDGTLGRGRAVFLEHLDASIEDAPLRLEVNAEGKLRA